MLNLMISKEILPNSFTLTALMKTCVTKGDWESARELLCIGANKFFQPIVDQQFLFILLITFFI